MFSCVLTVFHTSEEFVVTTVQLWLWPHVHLCPDCYPYFRGVCCGHSPIVARPYGVRCGHLFTCVLTVIHTSEACVVATVQLWLWPHVHLCPDCYPYFRG